MAYINNFYVFVGTEDVTRGVQLSTHPVEQGLDITDNVKRSPVTLSISGEIVGNDATTVLNSIQSLHQNGKYVKYSGRNIIKNAVIETFDTGHPNTITGGCSFTMTIKEIRVANSAYVPPTSGNSTNTTKKPTQNGTQQVQQNAKARYYKVKTGDTLWAIAKAYYGDGAQFTKIYQANKDKIKDPHWIYPNQVFLIP